MLQPMFRFVAMLAVALVPTARADEPKKEPPPAKPPTFKAPKGWEAVDRGKSDVVMVTARFRSGEGEKAVAVTLIGSGGEGGGPVANVNRWRSQVGLKELDEADVLKSLQPIKVDGLPAHLLDVTGPKGAEKPSQRVVAVMVKSGDMTWFIKMAGASAPVGEQKGAFDEFVKSIRFEK